MILDMESLSPYISYRSPQSDQYRLKLSFKGYRRATPKDEDCSPRHTTLSDACRECRYLYMLFDLG